MKKDYCDISVILDRSGSMGSIRKATIDGFNEFLVTQKNTVGTATLSLLQFDNEFEEVYSAIDINDVPDLTTDTFVPRGVTALNDAIGKTITSTGIRLAAMPEEERPDKVIVLILTDGGENASREYNGSKIREMITHQKEKYNWDFVFMGANQDAILTANAYNIDAGMSMTFAANANGASNAFASMGGKLSSYRSMDTDSLCSAKSAGSYTFFDEQDRDAQKQAGA